MIKVILSPIFQYQLSTSRRVQAEQRPARRGPPAVGLEHEVRRDAQTRRNPGAEAVLRDVRDPGRNRRTGVAAAQPLAADSHRALGGRAHARDRLGELPLAVAGDACNGDDLTGARIERSAPDGGLASVTIRPDALELEHGVTRCP